MTRRVRFTPKWCSAGVFACALGLAPGAAGAGDVPFVTQPPVATGQNLESIHLADIDSDGDQDIIAPLRDAHAIVWYENAAGDGTAWTPRTILTAVDQPLFVSTADVDGDGDDDVLFSSAFDGQLGWLENAGSVGPWAVHPIVTPSTYTFALALASGDVDRDGDVDVLAPVLPLGRLAWFENVGGSGTVWVAHTIATPPRTSAFVALAAMDLDRDGDLDAVTAALDTVAWYENSGNGAGWTPRTVTTALNQPNTTEVADVDGDGDLDVLTASGAGAVWWLEDTDGGGTAWTLHTIIATGLYGANSVSAADVDADGDADVVVPLSINGPLVWFENTAGNGTAWIRRTPAAPVGSSPAAGAGDIDGDGDLDLYGGLIAPGPVYAIGWLRNDTIHETACFDTRPPLSTLVGGAQHVFVADLDRDGDRDVIASSPNSDRVVWYRNTSGSADAWAVLTVATADRPVGVYAADIDGDGDLDVLSVSDVDDVLAWHSNVSGDGTTWVSRTISVGPGKWPLYAVAAGDVDGDGDQDVLSSVGEAGQVAWFENTLGNGTAWTTHTVDLAADLLRFVRPADVDDDGDLDVLWVSSYDDKVAWYDNTAGNGTAWVRRTISTAAVGAYSVMPADVDADGDIDAVASSFIDDKVAWHENADGVGRTWLEHTIATTADPGSAVFPAELDRDGDIDVLSVSGTRGHPAWFENTAGNGSAWAPQVLSTLTLEAAFLGAGDLDGDGDLDAITTSSAEAAPVVWYANGAGQVVTTVSDLAPPGAMNGDLVPMLGIVVAHGGRSGDGDVELARLGLLFEEAPGDPLTTAEANAIVESLRIYRDVNGNGLFEPGIDVLVTSIPTLALAAGVQLVTFTDGDPNVQVTQGSPRRYFVVTEITANANTQTPNRFRVTHLGLGPSASRAEDRTYDLPLRPACPADVSSSVLAPTPVELMDFRVE